MSLPQWWS